MEKVGITMTKEKENLKDLIHLESLKRYLEAKYKRDMMCLAKYDMEDGTINKDFVLCLLDKREDIKSIDVNEMNLNYYSVTSLDDSDISGAMHCIIRSKHLIGSEKVGFRVRKEDIQKGNIRIDKEIISDPSELWKIQIINNKVNLGL